VGASGAAHAVAGVDAIAGVDDDASAPLRVAGVTKRWPGNPDPVLDGVSLRLAPGEAVGVTGANGAGKTTLLRIATGILAADAGEVTVCGRTVAGDRAGFQRRVGFLSAGNSGLYARLSVRQHLAFWADVAFVEPERRAAAIAGALETFDLATLEARRTDRLSMGQRQRLRLALTFLHRPRVVLLDEPLTSLDQAGAAILEQVAREHRTSGGALLWCSPGGAHADSAFDRRLHLAAGRLEPA
jgi:heme ABC exporter ATP-binding subunit CcmA